MGDEGMNAAGSRARTGAAWLGIGAAFMGVAATGQAAFVGVGTAVFALGLVMLARARGGC
ncbi:MAG: hypothetical protein ABS96_05955 [Lysobacteraceae bacterium SCN 69-123]|jgi:hypothetical protein|nr:hypothetical protein [Stenotrophomonas acidaminiphila]MDF9440577.1 hypothetical protein [Stenotrophomonas acidaminiphila]ODU46958.1 MAG: hypothetical protein ABS96_05955 [Xanthomonadaceae bacterium SCN 69-123]